MADDTSWLMQGTPPSADAVVGAHNWTTAPYLRWGFLHTREVVPTARIERGEGPVLELPRDERPLDAIAFEAAGGGRTTVAEMLDDGFTDGFLVLHGGSIVCECYGNGMSPRTTHLLQSVSKSIAGTVAGVLVGRGLLDPARHGHRLPARAGRHQLRGCQRTARARHAHRHRLRRDLRRPGLGRVPDRGAGRLAAVRG